MKAVRIHELGPPGILRHEEVSGPGPGHGEALARLASAFPLPMRK